MLFFDFEVFIKDWLVVILDMDNRKEHVIINSPSDLKQFYQEHKTDIWVGFNNHHYDDYILKGILCDMNYQRKSRLDIFKSVQVNSITVI